MKYSQMELDDILERKYNAGLKWVEASAIYQRFDKGADEALRKLMAGYSNEPIPAGKRSWAHETLRDAALASDEWSTFLDDYNQAYEGMLRALTEKNHWETVFEAKRSFLAYERAFAK